MRTSHKTYSARVLPNSLADVLLVGSIVLAASLFGILTRPVGFLAAIWPANAILLGLMVRNRELATPANWIAAFVAYVAADLLTGNSLGITVWLTVANIAEVLLGFHLYMRLKPEDRFLNRPIAIVCLLAIAVLTSAFSAVIRTGVSHLMFQRDIIGGFTVWFTTELVNLLVILPTLLTWSGKSELRAIVRRARDPYRWLPAIALIALLVTSWLVRGPGAFAYPIPALIWCALSYSLFTTATLTLLSSIIQLAGASLGFHEFASIADPLAATISIRLAIAMIVLAPLAVASVNAAREDLLQRLNHTASHDALTGVLSRAAFLEQAEQQLGNQPANARVALLMMDIDYFKAINDRYGHLMGDKVLSAFAAAAETALSSDKLFGRLGGEEFAALLVGADEAAALAVAERLRRAVERVTVVAEDGSSISTTTSIGIASLKSNGQDDLTSLISRADKALYLAKQRGRNRVEIYRPEQDTQAPAA